MYLSAIGRHHRGTTHPFSKLFVPCRITVMLEPIPASQVKGRETPWMGSQSQNFVCVFFLCMHACISVCGQSKFTPFDSMHEHRCSANLVERCILVQCLCFFSSKAIKMSLYLFKLELLVWFNPLTQVLVNMGVYCFCHIQRFVVVLLLSPLFLFKLWNNSLGQCCHLVTKLISAIKIKSCVRSVSTLNVLLEKSSSSIQYACNVLMTKGLV